MSDLSPSDYANQWCDTVIRENDECKRGVTFAAQALQTQSAPDVVNQCTDFSGTEAYRYGCYLTTVFSGPNDRLCTTQLKAATGNAVTLTMPCAASCRTAFATEGQITTCQNTAEAVFNQLVQADGTCTAPALSCVDGLNQTGRTYNCTTEADRTNVCLPAVVGCTLGGLQSQFLLQAQQYQKSQAQTPLSCQAFVYSQQPSGPGGNGGGNNNPPPHWDPWPEGPTYKPNDGNGGQGGDSHVTANTFRL